MTPDVVPVHRASESVTPQHLDSSGQHYVAMFVRDEAAVIDTSCEDPVEQVDGVDAPWGDRLGWQQLKVRSQNASRCRPPPGKGQQPGRCRLSHPAPTSG
jgi:hypothetical protein